MKEILTCLLCGRNKFASRTAHKCVGGYRKRRLIWSDTRKSFIEWIKYYKCKRN